MNYNNRKYLCTAWDRHNMMTCLKKDFPLHRFCMVYSEVPNFSEPNPELLAQGNQQNKSVSHSAPTPNLSQCPPAPTLTQTFVFITIPLVVFSKLGYGSFTSELLPPPSWQMTLLAVNLEQSIVMIRCTAPSLARVAALSIWCHGVHYKSRK